MRWRPVAYTALGLTSLVVLAATGYGWTQLNRLTGGLATADVIEPAAQLPATTDPSVPVPEQNILLVGIDSRTDVQGRPLPQNVLDQLHAGDSTDGGDTTDTMIVVHIPAGGGSATAISIPRDSYVEVARGYGKHKINSAYSRGRQSAVNRLSAQGVQGPELERQADVEGARLAIQTVEQFTGLPINHYAAVNLAGFATISLAVGGVPVCLKAAVHDSYSGANFAAGEQTISGTQALAFVRQRHGLAGGDLDRIARQQAFLSSMAKVVLDAGTLANPSKLGALIDAVQQSVVIDKGWNLLNFAKQLRSLSTGALTFATIPVQSVSLQTPYDGDAVKVDPGEVRSFVGNLIGENLDRSASSSSPRATGSSSIARTDGVSAHTTESSPPPSGGPSSTPGTANSTSGRGADLTGCVN
ncbi:LCP family protein [Amycolatopsis taiwanensis]|uniref:LCP family protein n=1 Tax=Amycolatopsis taiwanensis TaxID=342230 RepID=UPI001FDF5992|nr:LCP family protein [Amycolatopsis taiwanensis]